MSEAEFDVAAEMGELANSGGVGGIGCFVGVVRSDVARPISALELEHYPGMTERAIGRIVAQAEARFGLLGCTVIHRVGRLPPGARIVLVLAASAHRAASLEATAFLIDWLKTRAPFWKREVYLDGEASWVLALDEDEQAAARWGGEVGAGV